MVESVAWTAEKAVRLLRVPTGVDDKYSRGVVGMRTGSEEFPGAAVLGVEGAWRTGVGMVRYVGPRRAEDLVLQRRPETVVVDGRADAWVVGSGSDESRRAEAETARLRELLSGSDPVIVDAGALGLAVGAAAPVVVTPHAREHERLREALGLAPVGDDVRVAVAETADALGGVVLLKGARTHVARPGGWVARVESGPSWLATAGTGDVLAGILGSLVAGASAGAADPVTPKALSRLAATGAWLHGHAARIAAGAAGPGGGPITALDVAHALPAATAELLALRA